MIKSQKGLKIQKQKTNEKLKRSNNKNNTINNIQKVKSLQYLKSSRRDFYRSPYRIDTKKQKINKKEQDNIIPVRNLQQNIELKIKVDKNVSYRQEIKIKFVKLTDKYENELERLRSEQNKIKKEQMNLSKLLTDKIKNIDQNSKKKIILKHTREQIPENESKQFYKQLLQKLDHNIKYMEESQKLLQKNKSYKNPLKLQRLIEKKQLKQRQNEQKLKGESSIYVQVTKQNQFQQMKKTKQKYQEQLSKICKDYDMAMKTNQILQQKSTQKINSCQLQIKKLKKEVQEKTFQLNNVNQINFKMLREFESIKKQNEQYQLQNRQQKKEIQQKQIQIKGLHQLINKIKQEEYIDGFLAQKNNDILNLKLLLSSNEIQLIVLKQNIQTKQLQNSNLSEQCEQYKQQLINIQTNLRDTQSKHSKHQTQYKYLQHEFDLISKRFKQRNQEVRQLKDQLQIANRQLQQNQMHSIERFQQFMHQQHYQIQKEIEKYKSSSQKNQIQNNGLKQQLFSLKQQIFKLNKQINQIVLSFYIKFKQFDSNEFKENQKINSMLNQLHISFQSLKKFQKTFQKTLRRDKQQTIILQKKQNHIQDKQE